LDALLTHWTAASVKARVLIHAQIAAFYRPFTSVVQKIALTSIVDQAITKLEATPARRARRRNSPGTVPWSHLSRSVQRGAKFVTSREEEYKRYARQCLEVALAFQDEEARATLLSIAQTWLRLAYLAQANRQIAELAVQIVRQRAIVKQAPGAGQHSEMAESLLDALEGSFRIFEKHRIFLLSCSATTNGQQGKSPGSEAGARLGFCDCP
jgi:hypothetical protein